MDYAEQIDALLRSFCSLFYLGSPNHRLMKEKCIEMGLRYSMEVCGYSISEGIWRKGEKKAGSIIMDPLEMLENIFRVNRETFRGKRKMFLLEHFDIILENRDPIVMTKLRNINDYSTQQYTVVLMGRPYFSLPEILSDIPSVYAPVMDSRDIRDIIKTCKSDLNEDDTEELAASLKGLTALECENLLSLSLAMEQKPDRDFVEKEKAFLLYQRAGRLIELCKPEGDLSQVGGLDVLRDWLVKRGRLVKGEGLRASGRIPFPRGLILTGPPGCGKSFVVSCLAGSWDVSLIKLGPSRLFSSLVGGTEQNFLTALETVKALAPCILWIDEFEKFFPQVSNSASDGGVLLRVLGLFLDFLQGERDGVFVCATTNSIMGLPQEMMRSGRFDAIFFVDLPKRHEREAIFNGVLRKYGLEKQIIISDLILDSTEAFSGAEIEQAVVETLYECGDLQTSATEFILLKNLKAVIPLARTMGEQIEEMREWCFSRARFASSPGNNDTNTRRRTCHISPK